MYRKEKYKCIAIMNHMNLKISNIIFISVAFSFFFMTVYHDKNS